MDGVDSTNKKIWMLGSFSEKCANMGTTLTCALCLPGRWVVAHVGDTRAYHIRGEQILQVTRDHSMVEDLVEQGVMEKDSPEYIMQRHILTRALGVQRDEPGEVYQVPAQAGDLLLICSDGLSEKMCISDRRYQHRDHSKTGRGTPRGAAGSERGCGRRGAGRDRDADLAGEKMCIRDRISTLPRSGW